MSLTMWLYATGISVSLTLALVWAAKALHCVSRPANTPATSEIEAETAAEAARERGDAGA